MECLQGLEELKKMIATLKEVGGITEDNKYEMLYGLVKDILKNVPKEAEDSAKNTAEVFKDLEEFLAKVFKDLEEFLNEVENMIDE